MTSRSKAEPVEGPSRSISPPALGPAGHGIDGRRKNTRTEPRDRHAPPTQASRSSSGGCEAVRGLAPAAPFLRHESPRVLMVDDYLCVRVPFERERPGFRLHRQVRFGF